MAPDKSNFEMISISLHLRMYLAQQYYSNGKTDVLFNDKGRFVTIVCITLRYGSSRTQTIHFGEQ
jgi:hypothetical protein